MNDRFIKTFYYSNAIRLKKYGRQTRIKINMKNKKRKQQKLERKMGKRRNKNLVCIFYNKEKYIKLLFFLQRFYSSE